MPHGYWPPAAIGLDRDDYDEGDTVVAGPDDTFVSGGPIPEVPRFVYADSPPPDLEVGDYYVSRRGRFYDPEGNQL